MSKGKVLLKRVVFQSNLCVFLSIFVFIPLNQAVLMTLCKNNSRSRPLHRITESLSYSYSSPFRERFAYAKEKD